MHQAQLVREGGMAKLVAFKPTEPTVKLLVINKIELYNLAVEITNWVIQHHFNHMGSKQYVKDQMTDLLHHMHGQETDYSQMMIHYE